MHAVVECAASYLSRRARSYVLGVKQGRLPLLEGGDHGMGHILRRILGLR